MTAEARFHFGSQRSSSEVMTISVSPTDQQVAQPGAGVAREQALARADACLVLAREIAGGDATAVTRARSLLRSIRVGEPINLSLPVERPAPTPTGPEHHDPSPPVNGDVPDNSAAAERTDRVVRTSGTRRMRRRSGSIR
jgi:hypothetical protein